MRQKKIAIFALFLVSFFANGEKMFDDFEREKFSEWKTKGSAFGISPVQTGAGTFSGWITDYSNNRFVCSSHNDASAIGKLRSKNFIIKKPFIGFLIAGGKSKATCIELKSNKQVLLRASGKGDFKMRSHIWDVKKWKGKEVYFEIIDSSQDKRGFIAIDSIIFSNKKKIEFASPSINGNPLLKKLIPSANFKNIQIPEKTKLNVFASYENHKVKAPTALSIDKKGDIYITETHRFLGGRGIDDNNERHFWLLEDIANQTIEDRLAMYRRWYHKIPPEYYTNFSEKVRKLIDKNKDGKADLSFVFADGFNHPLEGTASGILSWQDTIYLACIPHIWSLKDTNNDHIADERKSLQSGFGVRVSFSGHDLNGFTIGPDGKIYCTIGDRGFNIKTQEGKHFSYPDQGAVLRFDPDGRNLEVFYTGLRNPKEIAFDKYGNLITVDNNSDQGDRARLIYLLEGGDSGWRMGHQTLHTFYKQIGLQKRPMNAWMQEKMWQTENPEQPFYIIPPIANITSGPSGLTYYPGSGFLNNQKNHFLVCDYRGSPKWSRIWSFSLEQKEAGMRLTSILPLVQGIAATDVEYGYDGKVYFTDFIGGWETQENGKIWVLENKKKKNSNKTQKIIQQIPRKNPKELSKLLSHPDMRVRLEAQFALVKHKEGIQYFENALLQKKEKIKRIHAIWGIEMIARQNPSSIAQAKYLFNLAFRDSDSEIRAQATRSANQNLANSQQIIKLLKDPYPRTRCFAAITLGKMKAKEAFEPLLKMIAKKENQSPYLRHSGVMGIIGCGDEEKLASLTNHQSKAVRLASVIALRKIRSPQLKHFARDKNPDVSNEAIRAIHDEEIQEAQATLATLIDSPSNHPLSPIQTRRILHSAFRLGGKINAKRLLQFALSPQQEKAERIEAFRLLRNWQKPFPADQSTGKWSPLPQRSASFIASMLKKEMNTMLEINDEILPAAIDTVNHYSIQLPAKALVSILKAKNTEIKASLKIMEYLSHHHPSIAYNILNTYLNHQNEKLAITALKLLSTKKGKKFNEILLKALKSSNQSVRQKAWRIVGQNPSEKSIKVIKEAFLDLEKGIFPQETELDFLLATQKNSNPKAKDLYQSYIKKNEKSKFGIWKSTLKGGNPKKGKEVFYRHGQARCIRCHGNQNKHGSENMSGPYLGSIGKKSKEYLLEALILPSATIAQGFGEAPSSMPSMEKILNLEETRDLIAYLSTLKEKTLPQKTLPTKIQKEKSGELIYQKTCSACHLKNGEGIPNLAPSLKNVSRIDDSSYLIHLLIRGLKGDIKRNGKILRFPNGMPPHSHLSNKEIANIINYIQTKFGNIKEKKITPTTEKQVQSIRNQKIKSPAQTDEIFSSFEFSKNKEITNTPLWVKILIFLWFMLCIFPFLRKN